MPRPRKTFALLVLARCRNIALLAVGIIINVFTRHVIYIKLLFPTFLELILGVGSGTCPNNVRNAPLICLDRLRAKCGYPIINFHQNAIPTEQNKIGTIGSAGSVVVKQINTRRFDSCTTTTNSNKNASRICLLLIRSKSRTTTKSRNRNLPLCLSDQREIRPRRFWQNTKLKVLYEVHTIFKHIEGILQNI